MGWPSESKTRSNRDGLDSNTVQIRVQLPKWPNKPVQISLAKQTTGSKSSLSEYICYIVLCLNSSLIGRFPDFFTAAIVTVFKWMFVVFRFRPMLGTLSFKKGSSINAICQGVTKPESSVQLLFTPIS